MNDLFSGGEQEDRRRLHLLGWRAVSVPTASGQTRYHWQDPAGVRHTEDEAFAFLKDLDAKEASGGDHG
jgi:hypothetical protein